jgi:hypothetical protein
MTPLARAVRLLLRSAQACGCALLLTGCAAGAGPEAAVQEAIRAARAEDALVFQEYVETAAIPPADGVVLVQALTEVIRVGTSRRVEDAARVEVDVRPPGLDTAVTLALRLRRGERHWHVVQVENAGAFRSAIARAQANRLERENARIEGRIRRAVQLGAVQRAVQYRDVEAPDQVYRYADLVLRVPIYNARAAELAEAEVEVLVTDSAGSDYRYRLRTRGTVGHEATGIAALDTAIGVMTGYPTDYGHAREAEAVGTWRLVSARPISAVFHTRSGADSLRPYASWEDYVRRRTPAR